MSRSVRTICGTRYTQWDAYKRDQAKDFADALRVSSTNHEALSYLHRLGYDCSTAFVAVTVGESCDGVHKSVDQLLDCTDCSTALDALVGE